VVSDVAVVVRHPDGSFTLNREPFPATRRILGCTATGFEDERRRYDEPSLERKLILVDA